MEKVSSEEIRKIRKELNLTLEQFAQLLGVTARTVQRWDQKDKLIELGRTAGKKNLEHLVKVMENEVTKKELKKVLKKFEGAGKEYSIPLISSVLDTMALIAGTASFGLGGIYGREIIKMLQNVVDKTSPTDG